MNSKLLNSLFVVFLFSSVTIISAETIPVNTEAQCLTGMFESSPGNRALAQKVSKLAMRLYESRPVEINQGYLPCLESFTNNVPCFIYPTKYTKKCNVTLIKNANLDETDQVRVFSCDTSPGGIDQKERTTILRI